MAAARSATGLLLLLVLTGCAAGGPTARPAATGAVTAAPSALPAPEAVPTTSPGPSGGSVAPTEEAEQRCDHPTEAYSIAFPADWFVAAGDGIEPCTLFHLEPLNLTSNSEATGVAIRAEVRDVPFEQAQQDALAEGEQSAEDQVVADRAAVRLEGVLTEEALLPAGTRVTTWLVQLDAGTLLLTTDDAGEDDYAIAMEVLDAMAESLEIP